MIVRQIRARINVFNWNAEFLTIMKAAGVNVVIGNPHRVSAGKTASRRRAFGRGSSFWRRPGVRRYYIHLFALSG